MRYPVLASREELKIIKRDNIVQAAARVFAQKGYSGTVMADIAVTAGIGKGTIYEYFKSKEDLFYGVFEWFVRQMTELSRVDASALGGSPRTKLAALGDSLIKATQDMKDFLSLFMEFWAASGASNMRERFQQVFREIYAGFRGIISALIREGVRRGEFRSDVDPESIAAVLVGSWDGLYLQSWFDPAFDAKKAGGEFMFTLLEGLSARDVRGDSEARGKK